MSKQDFLTVNFCLLAAYLVGVKKTERVSLKITADLKKRLDDVAKSKDRSVNWLVTKFIEDGLRSKRNVDSAPSR